MLEEMQRVQWASWLKQTRAAPKRGLNGLSRPSGVSMALLGSRLDHKGPRVPSPQFKLQHCPQSQPHPGYSLPHENGASTKIQPGNSAVFLNVALSGTCGGSPEVGLPSDRLTQCGPHFAR